MVTRENIIERARLYLDVPWRHQGRSHLGIDCVGLLFRTGIELNLVAEDYINYPERPNGEFLSRFDERLDRILPRDATPGDILVFTMSSYPCHCGILTTHRRQQPGLIHAHARRRKVLEETLEAAVSLTGDPTHAYSYRGLE